MCISQQHDIGLDGHATVLCSWTLVNNVLCNSSNEEIIISRKSGERFAIECSKNDRRKALPSLRGQPAHPCVCELI